MTIGTRRRTLVRQMMPGHLPDLTNSRRGRLEMEPSQGTHSRLETYQPQQTVFPVGCPSSLPSYPPVLEPDQQRCIEPLEQRPLAGAGEQKLENGSSERSVMHSTGCHTTKQKRQAILQSCVACRSLIAAGCFPLPVDKQGPFSLASRFSRAKLEQDSQGKGEIAGRSPPDPKPTLAQPSPPIMCNATVSVVSR